MTTPIPSEELLPCPCCGKPPKLVDWAGWEIVCDCGINLCLAEPDKEPLIARWNLREHSSKEVADWPRVVSDAQLVSEEIAIALQEYFEDDDVIDQITAKVMATIKFTPEVAEPVITYVELNDGLGTLIQAPAKGYKPTKDTQLFLAPPSSHQAASSMKQKCLDELKILIGLNSASWNAALREAYRQIQAIPTVEESK